MNVYIATKFENVAGFNKARALLEEFGHTVSHDWTVHNSADYPIRSEGRHEIALEDGSAVCDADAMLLLCEPNMAGAWTEMGIALALRKAIYVVNAFGEGVANNLFLHLKTVDCFDSVESAVQAITKTDADYNAKQNAVRESIGQLHALLSVFANKQ